MDPTSDRLAHLERIALEYARLENLILDAARGQTIERGLGQGTLYVDPNTQHIVDANTIVLEFLGYSKAELIGLPIQTVELPHESASDSARQPIEEQEYNAFYQHRLGHTVAVWVSRRLVNKRGGNVWYYHLEEQSLYRQLWREFQRREDATFNFQQRLKTLSEITIELSRLDSFDALCRQVITLGVERLGFDRLGMWFHDAEHHQMRGSYGVDEHGFVRSEQDQRWSYEGTYIMEFMSGKTEASLAVGESPIYNERSEIIHYGWHISAPMLHGDKFVGIIASDNYLNNQAMKPYEPELLRLYGITVGHLTELVRTHEQAFALRLEEERTDLLKKFIADIGHDFRTPLSVINTNSFLIQKVPDADKQRSLAQGIQQQVTYLSQMLDNTLKYILLETDLDLSFSPTNLHTLLNDVVTSHHTLMASKSIQCDLPHDTTWTVPADAHYLHQALSKIFENALHYTPNGGRIQVSFAQYPTAVGIRIQDNGMGIPEDALDKIFKPLYRVDAARTERRSGLGLAIAKTIVEAHRGRIVVNSQVGVGSTFEVILPQG